jgi:hypothetical protein
MTDFQLRLRDILTTPEGDFKKTIKLDDNFLLLGFEFDNEPVEEEL